MSILWLVSLIQPPCAIGHWYNITWRVRCYHSLRKLGNSSQSPSLKDPGPSPHEDCNIELFWGDHSRKVGDNPVPGGQHVDDQLLIAYASLSYAAGFPKQIVIWPHLHTSLHRGFAL